VKVRLEAGPEGMIRFRLASGSRADFRRIIVPYAGNIMTGASGSSMLVPVATSKLACAALGKSGVSIFADPSLQALVLSSAWRCTLSSLYPFQRTGAEFLRSRRRAILADQMGLGKTSQALAAIDARKPAVVVAPPVVLGSWFDECRRWRPDLQVSIWRRPYYVVPDPGELRIISYSMLPTELIEERTRCPFCGALTVMKAVTRLVEDEAKEWSHKCVRESGGCGRLFDQREDAFVEHVWCGPRPKNPVQLVVDEAHYCKSRKAKRTLFVRALASQCQSTWLLTGTPLLNTPEELWSLCQIFPGPGPFANGAYDAFDSWKNFVDLFHGTKKKYGGYEWSVAGDVAAEAVPRLGTLMLRRMRDEVLPELPKKTRRFLQVEIDMKGLPVWNQKLESMNDEEVLAACAPEGSLSEVRRLLAERKISSLLQLVSDFEESSEPVIVFSYHRAPIEQLGSRPGWACITGGTPDGERATHVRAFQAGKLRGIAGTIGAMGVGVTLTRAANEIFLDRDFVPANNLQAEDRAARIGQERAVFVTILMTDHPVDLRVRDVLARKERLLESMQLGDGEVAAEVQFQAKAKTPMESS